MARLLLRKDSELAAEYYNRTCHHVCGDIVIPKLQEFDRTDFSVHFDYLEEKMPELLNGRIARSQVVNANHNALNRIGKALRGNMVNAIEGKAYVQD